MDFAAFNTSFAGAFGGTLAAIVLFLLVRYAMTLDDPPSWVWFAIAAPCALFFFALI